MKKGHESIAPNDKRDAHLPVSSVVKRDKSISSPEEKEPLPQPAEELISVEEKESIISVPYQSYKKKIMPKEDTSIEHLITYNTAGINKKYKELLTSIFKKEPKIAWKDVKNMMTNAFKGKMYGAKGGSKRQFAIFLKEIKGKEMQFVSLDDYNNYLKSSRGIEKLGYTIVRKIVTTETPHSRGAHKKGQTRFLYPALVDLLVSSLEKICLTPKSLGWE